MVVSAAISQHIYISINRTFTDDYFLKYGQLERVDKPDHIEHPIVREVLLAHDVGPRVEIVSTADIPSGTGLGSSGSFTVGLLQAVHAMQRNHVTAADLGEEACEIEIDRLGRTVGKQDQYIAAFGGITGSTSTRTARSTSHPRGSPPTPARPEEHLLMFFTGYSRAADQVLEEQVTRSKSGDQSDDRQPALRQGPRSASSAALERDDVEGFADLMHEHWENKKKRSSVDVEPAHRPPVRGGPEQRGAGAASWSAPVRAAS